MLNIVEAVIVRTSKVFQLIFLCPTYFLRLFMTSIVDWGLVFHETQHCNIYGLNRVVFALQYIRLEYGRVSRHFSVFMIIVRTVTLVISVTIRQK